jgi:tetratricopeptide (TPR) repeat protein
MSTKKKMAPSKPAAAGEEKKIVPQRSAAYEAALAQYTEGLDLLHRGSFAEALERFRAIRPMSAEEPVLAERAKTYATICERRLAGPAPRPESADACYHLGVVKANEGSLDEALALLDRAVERDPGNASYLYARASVRALQGNAQASAADLKKSISLDPHVRFQVGNDEDFARVRDEAVFIDVIEPTPPGV